ncbi:MAG TPA: PTS ascorbate transporter subunit IIC, partial [Candidatus Ruthenibacterium merdipullorum]|nr:PTS ascorbate transporter subunit IIC [Candidatus Ruthenibacterium merdipullorum]
MEAIINIAQFIANNLFNQLAIMMAIIALIGLLFQKKSIEQAIAGALRAAIGVIILNVGVSVFTGELSYFTNIMSSAF